MASIVSHKYPSSNYLADFSGLRLKENLAEGLHTGREAIQCNTYYLAGKYLLSSNNLCPMKRRYRNV